MILKKQSLADLFVSFYVYFVSIVVDSHSASISIDTSCSTCVDLHDHSHYFDVAPLLGWGDIPYANLIKDILNISSLLRYSVTSYTSHIVELTYTVRDGQWNGANLRGELSHCAKPKNETGIEWKMNNTVEHWTSLSFNHISCPKFQHWSSKDRTGIYTKKKKS